MCDLLLTINWMNGDVQVINILLGSLARELKSLGSMFQQISFARVFWEHIMDDDRLSKVGLLLEEIILLLEEIVSDNMVCSRLGDLSLV